MAYREEFLTSEPGLVAKICTTVVFLEVNQAGEWQWIEQLTGILPIGDAIANALITAPNWDAHLVSPSGPTESA